MANGKKAKRRPLWRIARVHFGPPGSLEHYWRVKTRDTTKAVKINGSLIDAILGNPGTNIGCHLSNSGCNKANKTAWEAAGFPLPKIMSFTATRAIAIHEFKKGTLNGQPYDAVGVEFAHDLGLYTDLNDKDPSKRYLERHPEIANLEIRLHPPYRGKSRPQKVKVRPRGKSTGGRRMGAAQGALLRAQKAGLIPPAVARQIEESQ